MVRVQRNGSMLRLLQAPVRSPLGAVGYSTVETIAPIRHVGSDDEKKGGTKKNDFVSLF